ncbi:MAG TPA: DnaJ domain-containing protein [Pyrinomonadaceae bacterium]|jgi:hypothetical protein
MSDEREKCLELLGLKPGASAQEIKAAYRDLAKVWHPDRFAHDARLQEKAQNKLKEINEAYEALTTANFSRSTTRPRSSADESTMEHAAPPRSQQTSGKYLWPVMILVACFGAFALYISPRLSQSSNDEAGQVSISTAQPVEDEESQSVESPGARQERKIVEKQKAVGSVTSPAPIEPRAPLRAIPTVTVTIDPTTGLLATSACPARSSMTYVGGQEPRQYCSAERHQTARAEEPADSRKKSKLKSMLNRAAAPARWLKDKTREAGQDN